MDKYKKSGDIIANNLIKNDILSLISNGVQIVHNKNNVTIGYFTDYSAFSLFCSNKKSNNFITNKKQFNNYIKNNKIVFSIVKDKQNGHDKHIILYKITSDIILNLERVIEESSFNEILSIYQMEFVAYLPQINENRIYLTNLEGKKFLNLMVGYLTEQIKEENIHQVNFVYKNNDNNNDNYSNSNGFVNDFLNLNENIPSVQKYHFQDDSLEENKSNEDNVKKKKSFLSNFLFIKSNTKENKSLKKEKELKKSEVDYTLEKDVFIINGLPFSRDKKVNPFLNSKKYFLFYTNSNIERTIAVPIEDTLNSSLSFDKIISLIINVLSKDIILVYYEFKKQALGDINFNFEIIRDNVSKSEFLFSSSLFAKWINNINKIISTISNGLNTNPKDAIFINTMIICKSILFNTYNFQFLTKENTKLFAENDLSNYLSKELKVYKTSKYGDITLKQLHAMISNINGNVCFDELLYYVFGVNRLHDLNLFENKTCINQNSIDIEYKI